MLWTIDEIIFWVLSFALGATGGLAWLLRSQALVMTARATASSTLNSGLCGAVTAVLCREYGGGAVPVSLGFAILAGIGGVTFVELVSRAIYVVFRKVLDQRYQVGGDLAKPHEKDGKEIFYDGTGDDGKRTTSGEPRAPGE
jgi:hypothetical protein